MVRHPTLTVAILDRIVHACLPRIKLSGETLREDVDDQPVDTTSSGAAPN
jgi:hypothetical protein